MRIQGEETSNVYENILNDGKQVSNAAMVSSHYRIPCATARNSGAYKCIIDNGLTKLEHVAKVFVGKLQSIEIKKSYFKMFRWKQNQLCFER